eukprot:XP_002257970.1 hypothetical protein, conserved in Plasmodium species [Plasmodium knowlesi strain H]
MSLLCDPNSFHLFVEDDLGSFLSSLEKERQSTSHIVILTDQATFLNKRPALLATLKFLLRHPAEDPKGNLSPQGGLYTIEGNLQNCQNIDNPPISVEETKSRNRFVLPRSDDENHLGEKLTHSSREESDNQDGKKNSEEARQEMRIDNQIYCKSAHQMVRCEANKGTTHILGVNESIQQIFEKYEQSLVEKTKRTPHVFAHQVKNVLMIISKTKKWDDKVEVAHQLIDLFDRNVTLEESQIICFAKETCDAVKGDRCDGGVHTNHQKVIPTYDDNAICADSVTHVRRELITSLKEEDCKGILTQALKLAILNDRKLFSNIKNTDMNQFKKRIKYFLRRLLMNSCKISRNGRRDILKFGSTIGNAIKNATGNPLNGIFTKDEIFFCYGIFYELKMMYEIGAVDLIFLMEVEEIMMKHKMKYKLSNNYLNYYTHDIIQYLTKEHPSGMDKILLVHVTGIGEVHPDVMISVPLCVVCKVLYPMVSFHPTNMHLSLQENERINTLEPFVHIRHVGNKSEAIRVIYVSCMSRENICIRNVSACLDVVVFVKILKELKFEIRLARQGKTTTSYPDDSSAKEYILHIKGNIQRSVFLFKRFIYERGITLNVYNCGTVCRFILPLLCIYICKQNLKAKKRKKKVLKWILLKGNKQMETTRIIGPLVQVLRQAFNCLNIEYTKKENYLPICISVKEGANVEGGIFSTEYLRIDNYHSSQFVSSMLLLSTFSETDTCIGLTFKRIDDEGRGEILSQSKCGKINGHISQHDGREENPTHNTAQRSISPRQNRIVSCIPDNTSYRPLHHRALSALSIRRNGTTAHNIQGRYHTIEDGQNNSTSYATSKGATTTTQQFSTTSKSFIDLTIRVMKLWGVQVGMKNFCYVLKKSGRYPSYGRGRRELALRKFLVSRIKRFICVVTGVRRWCFSPTGLTKQSLSKHGLTKHGLIKQNFTKQSLTKCEGEDGKSDNTPVRLPVDVKGEEVVLNISLSSSTPIYTAKCAPSYRVQNDLGLLIYFIIGCLIRGKNCAIDVGLRLDGIDLYADEGAVVRREMNGPSEHISHGFYFSDDAHDMSFPQLRRIKAIRFQANISNYALLNVFLLLGVDIYVKEGGNRRKSKKLYLLTSKRMNIRQEWIRGLLLQGEATSRGGKDPLEGKVKQAKWEVFQNIYLKMKLLSNKMHLKVVVDVENFSDDFFSLSVLFCYYLLLHPTEYIFFKIKNVRNQNIKESVRVYNSVIILKLFFQNVLCIFCDRNSVYISRMGHPIQNCLFYRMCKERHLPPGEAISESASPTSAQLENNSKYVTNDKGEVYLYVDTRRDHRIIFMVSILSLLGGNILIDNTGEVEKSFPHFFDCAHRYLGLNVDYTTCGNLNFYNFTKLCKYRLVSGGTYPPSAEPRPEEGPPSEASLMWSDSSARSDIHDGSTEMENFPRGSQVKCIQNYQKRGEKNMAIKMGEAEKEKNFHVDMEMWPNIKEGTRREGTKFTDVQTENPPSGGDGSTNSSLHLEARYLHEEANCVDSPTREIISAEMNTVQGESGSISTQNKSKFCGTPKREKNMLSPSGEKQPLKDTCREKFDKIVANRRGILPRDPNYWREYQYETLLHGNDADILHLINQVNNLNISIICGIRNVGKSYLSKRIKTRGLVIDLDEFILDGPIRFDQLTIDDFRYYEYITFVSMLYLVYLIFSGEKVHYHRGGKPLQSKENVLEGEQPSLREIPPYPMGRSGEEAQGMFRANPFLTLREDMVLFYNKKVNRLYHKMKEKHFLNKDEVGVESVTIVLGGGIVEFEKSRQLMDKVKNLLLIKRPPEEIYHMCMNDKVKPPLSGNLEEIIKRRTVLFENLNAFHFAIPSEEDIKRCLKNAPKSRNELIVSSFLNFFNYQFFVKPTIKHTYVKMATTGKTILSLRLTEFYSFDYTTLDGTYEVVELVMDLWPNGNIYNEEKERKTDLLQLAIFIIRSYTDKPICVKFPKWILDPTFSEPLNEASSERKKKTSYRYTLNNLYKYRINIFDVDVNFFKKVNNFMPRKRENIFLILSNYRENIHKKQITTDLYKLDKSEADLVRLTFGRATQSDRETLHLEIIRHYERKLGNPLISHVRGIREAPWYKVPPDQVSHQERYEISAYTSEVNDSLVFLHNDVSHVGCPQWGLAVEEKKGQIPHHKTYMHSFYQQGVKTIISCIPL